MAVESYRLTTEGRTKFYVPAASITSPIPPTSPAFFNPRGRKVRDLAVLACRAYTKLYGEADFGDPLAGVGAKSLRVLVESEGIVHAYINDLNSTAIKLARRSAAANLVLSKASFTVKSANQFLELHARPSRRFSIIDLDPFGSPTEFVDSAIRALQYGGMLSLTATDTAPLSGVYRKVAFRKYFGYSLRTDFSRELGLRLLCAMVVRRGIALDMFPRPVFVHSDQHYMRAYFFLETGAEAANRAIDELNFIIECNRCGAVTVHREPTERCEECGSSVRYCGPAWTGPILDRKFIRQMGEEARGNHLSRHRKLLRNAGEEIDYPPFYYNIPRIADRLGAPAPSPTSVIESLVKQGWHATLTIIDPQGVRTDAPLSAVTSLIRKE